MSDAVQATVHSCVAAIGTCISAASPNELVSFVAGFLTVVYMTMMIVITAPKINPVLQVYKDKLRSKIKEWFGR